ncbi:UTP--glucose-1-phosphate uridylyltransferase GalU [Aquifex sp.]
MRNIRKAVLPVAGWGTRFLPATKAMPKEMLPIIDKPIIQFIVEALINVGIENLVFVTGRHKKAIENHFDHNVELEEHLKKVGKEKLLKEVVYIANMINPIYVRQKEQLGLGHAVLMAEPAVSKEPFIVALVDIIIDNEEKELKKMLKLFKKFGNSVVALMEVPWEEVSNYGIAKIRELDEETYIIEDLVEKPSPEDAPSNLAIVGRYAFTPTIFEKLKITKPGKGGEIQLTDAMKMLLEEEAIYAYKVKNAVYDTGTPLGYLKTVITFALRREDINGELKEFIENLLASSQHS